MSGGVCCSLLECIDTMGNAMQDRPECNMSKSSYLEAVIDGLRAFRNKSAPQTTFQARASTWTFAERHPCRLSVGLQSHKSFASASNNPA